DNHRAELGGFEVQAHDKEEEKMRNIEYMISCARSARTSPSIFPTGDDPPVSSHYVYLHFTYV
ncbi:MAG: hypothetical protein KKH85_01655, partial [Proteobacteria bacterium]|nr:hypothetical protein [Pseudomonadota bacterium]